VYAYAGALPAAALGTGAVSEAQRCVYAHGHNFLYFHPIYHRWAVAHRITAGAATFASDSPAPPAGKPVPGPSEVRGDWSVYDASQGSYRVEPGLRARCLHPAGGSNGAPLVGAAAGTVQPTPVLGAASYAFPSGTAAPTMPSAALSATSSQHHVMTEAEAKKLGSAERHQKAALRRSVLANREAAARATTASKGKQTPVATTTTAVPSRAPTAALTTRPKMAPTKATQVAVGTGHHDTLPRHNGNHRHQQQQQQQQQLQQKQQQQQQQQRMQQGSPVVAERARAVQGQSVHAPRHRPTPESNWFGKCLLLGCVCTVVLYAKHMRAAPATEQPPPEVMQALQMQVRDVEEQFNAEVRASRSAQHGGNTQYQATSSEIEGL
jgi:hypothetical protein